MSIEWVTHKGKKILHIKYAGLTPEAMCDQIRTATKTIVETGKEDNLVVTDMVGCFVNSDFVELAKEQSKISMLHCKKSAIVGLSGIKNMLLKAVNAISPKSRVPFDDLGKAMDWLAE
jgi:predicted dinucleotide-utilizing enzyme